MDVVDARFTGEWRMIRVGDWALLVAGILLITAAGPMARARQRVLEQDEQTRRTSAVVGRVIGSVLVLAWLLNRFV